ncbi:hypothetical protein [Streptomyces collinus]|uniref:hypothetical protein n=1 Tax=Streptomyces collinus TaxID=42684 RepID=UPI0036D0ACFE
MEGETCARIAERVGVAWPRLPGLLVVPDRERRSVFDVIQEPGRRVTWSLYRQNSQRVVLVDGFGDGASWVEGVAAAKVSAVRRAGGGSYRSARCWTSEPQRIAVLACTMGKARARVRDESW